MKQKKMPVRVCAGCQEQKLKKDMIRIVRTAEGEVMVDSTGRKAGRGVYLCHDAQCLAKARKEHRLERSLKATVSDEIYESVLQDLV
ncbi:DUF448 domain-containing protein [Veillonellaceae bacterium M2-8]|nr:YlxR family protein [uncultured Megasphaera sp.]MUP48661.1 DUF448 domain-containing protein [Veillonellaceae bacterium M2-8]